MWIPALQRQEARPIGVMLFLWGLFLLPVASCGGMGTYKLVRSRDATISVSAPAELESIKLGSYVDTNVQLTRKARDKFSSDGDYAYVARGFTAYSVADAPSLIVIAEEEQPRKNDAAHLLGQICDGDAKFVCSLPNEELEAYVRSLQRTRKGPVRVLMVGAAPRDNVIEAFIGLGVTGFVLLMALLSTLLLFFMARRPGTVAFERTISLKTSAEHLRAAIRTQTSSICRVAHDSPERMVLLAGKPMSRARLTGATETRDIPLRIDLEFGPHDAYRGAVATIRVTQLMGGAVVQPVRVWGQVHAQPTAAEVAGTWMLGLCEQA